MSAALLRGFLAALAGAVLMTGCMTNHMQLRSQPTQTFPTSWESGVTPTATVIQPRVAAAPTPAPAAPVPQAVAPRPPTRAKSGKMLAVLTFKTDKSAGLGFQQAAMITDYVRQLAFKAAGHHEIMTSENMEVLLKSHGTTLAKCAEAACEVEFGQKIGADFVVSGNLSKLGSYIFLNLKAHDTAKGVLLGAETVKAKDVDGLIEGLDAAAAALLGGL
jgi:hypothetical protein